MPVDHYENFPVASLLLPPAMRRPIEVVYRFARSADDIADEGDATPEERLAALGAYRAELNRIGEGHLPATKPFLSLGRLIHERKLPVQLFNDLIDAFAQDVVKTRYSNYHELLDYCRRSANPVGRIVLHLAGCDSAENLARSDAICTALQLVNFWQDIAIDWQKSRVYLPQDEMQRYSVRESDIAEQYMTPAWTDLLEFQCERAERLLRHGAPLVHALPGRLGWEIRLTIQGGLRILEKIRRVDGDIFRHRPVLGPWDWFVMALRCPGM